MRERQDYVRLLLLVGLHYCLFTMDTVIQCFLRSCLFVSVWCLTKSLPIVYLVLLLCCQHPSL